MFLIQQSLHLLGIMVSSLILPFNASDHKPILLELSKEQNLGLIPFHFDPSWIHQEGFQELVQSVWKTQVFSSAFNVWEEKLWILKHSLKARAKAMKSPLKKRLEVEHNLEQLQLQMEEGIIDSECLEKEATLQHTLHSACCLEEDHWREKFQKYLA